MKEEGLTKEERLYLREEIGALFAGGDRFVCYPYRVIWRLVEPSTAPLKVLVSVPKRRIRHAVDRNCLKRRTREAWRRTKGPLRSLCAEQDRTLLVGLLYIGDHVSHTPRITEAVTKTIERLCAEVCEESSHDE